MKICIYWVTNDWRLIRRILKALRKGEPEYLIIRKIEK